MARIVYPDPGDRLAFMVGSGSGSNLRNGVGIAVTIYTDAGGTTLANILTWPGGAAVPGSVLTTGSDSLLPWFQGPDGTTGSLYAKPAGGSVQEIRPRDPPGSGGTTLTVQDEGTPLATAADTLNFVGAGVTATGTGATKTVTVPGATFSGVEILLPAPIGGGADDWSALTTAIAASGVGDLLRFRKAPASAPYLFSQPLVRPTGRIWEGAGGWSDGTVLKARNGSSAAFTNASGHSGVFVPASWDGNLTTAQDRETIRGIAIDGNRANNATGQHHGLIMHGNFWSRYEDIRIYECRRSGLHLTPFGKDGTSSMPTGLSDFVLRDILLVNNTEHGCWNRANSGTGAYHSDVVWSGSTLIFNNDANGLNSENSGGWAFDGTLHHWDNGKHGVYLQQAYGARIAHIYGESLGRLGVSGEFLFGIRIEATAVIPDGRGTFIHDCHQTVTAPNTGVTHFGVSLITTSNNGHIWAHDIEAKTLGGAGGANEYGFDLWKGSSGTDKLNLHAHGLVAHGFQDYAHQFNIAGSGTLVYDPPWLMTGTATWNPGAVTAGTISTVAVTVTGAAVGDTVDIGFTPALAALTSWRIWWAVTAANTVTVAFENRSGGSITPASTTVRADVSRH